MADGDTAKAQELLAEAEALLGDDANPGQLNRIDKLNGDPPGQSGSQSAAEPGSEGLTTRTARVRATSRLKGRPERVNDPRDKGPVDHDPKGKGRGTSRL